MFWAILIEPKLVSRLGAPFDTVLNIQPTINWPFDPPGSPRIIIGTLVVDCMPLSRQVIPQDRVVTQEPATLLGEQWQVHRVKELPLVEQHSQDDHLVALVQARRFHGSKP